MGMITFVLSHILGAWHLHRYGEDVTVIATYILSEEQALEMALQIAEKEAPSQVLRITQSGDNEIVRRF
jgi:hypothetical protein